MKVWLDVFLLFLSGRVKCPVFMRIEVARLKRLRKGPFRSRTVTSAAEADTENKPVIAAVNRCATQNQVQDRVFSKL
jgi:hypothetical protein